jgi:hypothetical protein
MLHMNDTNIDKHSPIFDELYKIYDAPASRTTHSSPPTQSRNINTDEATPHTHHSMNTSHTARTEQQRSRNIVKYENQNYN